MSTPDGPPEKCFRCGSTKHDGLNADRLCECCSEPETNPEMSVAADAVSPSGTTPPTQTSRLPVHCGNRAGYGFHFCSCAFGHAGDCHCHCGESFHDEG